MLTYKLWEAYCEEFWYCEGRLDFFEISARVIVGFVILLVTTGTIIADILLIPVYIIAGLIWYIRER